MTAELEEKLQHIPDQPGVYLMKDQQDRIIYVGKAVVLKNRVRSYFQSSRNQSAKVRALVNRIEDLEYIVTGSEMEALILECNLIKKYQPKYNIRLRDDKSYPYIKVTMSEDYPRVFATRKVTKDGARYFGPYTDASAMHETIRLLRRLFPLRTCRQLNAPRPCLQFHIRRCLAPCSGKVSVAEYREMADAICLFLEGRSDAVAKTLRKRMEQAAEALEYELAARYRDQLSAVEKVTEKQNIVTGSGDQDVVGMARSAAGTCVQVFMVRSGKMVGRDHFLLTNSEDETDESILTAFLKQYYNQTTFIPREILLPFDVEERQLLAEWLTAEKQGKVQLEVPRRGAKKDLLAMAGGNASTLLEELAEQAKTRDAVTGKALEELAEHLMLPGAPERIECFDISHIQGAETVASMVVFEGGEPKKDDYRRFKLRTVEGKPDDFKSMQEVVLRRYGEAAEPLPDLIIIDGGKGQLGAALQVIRGVGLTDIPVVGLAKEFEHIFQEGESDPLILPRHSPSLYLVQRIRDEAHRFAVTYHRKLRSKRNLVSVLDHIPGIGEKRRTALWQHFGSLAKMKQASLEDLSRVPGINRTAAQAVYNFFNRAQT